jgi:DOPA 4,5-dioxygenase
MAGIRDVGVIEDYHAHIYFDAASREAAWALRERIEAAFDIQMGRFHEKNVGPHPRWSYQVLFRTDQFADFVPWLMLNRGELTIFLHPNTEDDLADHRDNPIWMGECQAGELKLEIFDR